MVFLNLRSGSKAGLLFHSKYTSRRKARARFRAESRKRTRVRVGIAGDIWRKAPLTLIRFDPPVLIFSDPWMVS
jgi:hypothetical protein